MRALAGSTSGATGTATASSSTSAGRCAGSPTSRGRTPATRSASPTGALAPAPIAPCEVQGYVYDAKRRMAELAREVWRDRELAERLDAEAEELRALRRGVLGGGARRLLRARARRRQAAGRLALLEHRPSALERDRPEERVEAIVDQLLGEPLWSGWGVRTMSTEDAGYNPLSVPQRHRLAARQLPDRVAGSRATGAGPRRTRSPGGCSRRPRTSTTSCPEVFAGLRALGDAVPDPVPDAARPQAWAAGTPVLLLQLLLGLRPTGTGTRSRPSRRPSCRPGSATIRLAGFRAFGRRWDVRLEDGARAGGGSRRVRSRSVARSGSRSRRPATAASSGSSRCSRTASSTPGTTSTLFASGDSRTKAELRDVYERGAERVDRPHVLGAAALLLRARRARTSSTSSTTTPACSG